MPAATTMKARSSFSSPVGLVALSCSTLLLLLAGRVAASSAGKECIPGFQNDGDCDDVNNNMECEYDGGDCCEETCSNSNYICGGNAGYDCLDPDYGEMSYSYEFGCEYGTIGDSYCDPVNNYDECGYDGGDCCDCTCPDCDGQDGWTCEDPSAPCLDFYIEAGTVTTVTVSANSYETSGCMDEGCTPYLTRDDIVEEDGESRWSCLQPDDPCTIKYEFVDSLYVEIVQVAFSKPDEQPRSVQVTVNGDDAGMLHSSPESVYTPFFIPGDVLVKTVTITTLDPYSSIDLDEVRFMVNQKIHFYGDGR